MSYSYTNSAEYMPIAQDVYYQQPQTQQKSHIGTIGAVAGGALGGFVGAKKVPYFVGQNNKKEVNDNFTKKVYETTLKSTNRANKPVYKQINKVLKKLKSVNSSDKLIELLEKNPEAKNLIDNELIGQIKDLNVADCKRVIKEKLNVVKNEKFLPIRTYIKECWNPTKKVFENNSGISEDTFNAIKKAAREVKAGSIVKGVGIGALLGFVTAAIAKIISLSTKNIQQQ